MVWAFRREPSPPQSRPSHQAIRPGGRAFHQILDTPVLDRCRPGFSRPSPVSVPLSFLSSNRTFPGQGDGRCWSFPKTPYIRFFLKIPYRDFFRYDRHRLTPTTVILKKVSDLPVIDRHHCRVLMRNPVRLSASAPKPSGLPSGASVQSLRLPARNRNPSCCARIHRFRY